MLHSQHWGVEELLCPRYSDPEITSLPFEYKLVDSEAHSLWTNDIRPKWAVSPSFTSCVMAALGTLTMHSFFEIVLTKEGGFTSWAPYLTLLVIVSIVSWRGGIAANGKGLGLSAFVPLLLIASIFLVSVRFEGRQVHQLPENPPRELKQGLRRLLNFTSRLHQGRKMTEANVVSISEDEILDWAPILLPAVLVSIMLFRVSTHRSAIPHQMLHGSVPWCVMVGGCTWVAREVHLAILRSGGIPQHLIGYIGVNLVAVLGCQVGLKLQW